MRTTLLIGLAAATLAAAVLAVHAAALAQPYDPNRARVEAEQRDIQAQQSQQADMDRQAAQAAQRDAYAATDRLRTESTLRGLEYDRLYPARALPPPATVRGRAALDSRMRSDNARLDALTDRALAASNARIRAVQPASKPKHHAKKHH
ncbi:MAG: hypothetical protein JWP35_1315 [Caulobacter sp.]|nr:hypothetical protein [Caulobacter sp.]